MVLHSLYSIFVRTLNAYMLYGMESISLEGRNGHIESLNSLIWPLREKEEDIMVN